MAEEPLLTEEQAALVFRRAAELESSSTSDDGGGFDVATLERIGAEAGLSPAAIRRAVDELRTGRLDAGVSRAPVPRRAVVERLVPVPPDVASERLERFLRSQVMRVCRRRGPLTVWEPSHGLGANLVRGIDILDRMRLSRVDGVELLVERSGDGAAVRVVLDLARIHRSARTGTIAGGVVGAGGIVAGVAGLVLGAPEALLAVPASAGTGAGAYFGARSTYAKHVRRAIEAVELVLDELEHPPRSG
ncbi:MAG TPA: hypothetical protein VM933_01200 [Acidimicrobiales bacterium]|nr:hypothetical protein [Acidimicrobiales bacterium]